LIVAAIISLPLMIILAKLRPDYAGRFFKLLTGFTLKIAGIKIEKSGNIENTKSTIYVSNHSSYIDIIILGNLINRSFVAKREVGGWPFIGNIAKLVGTVFIDRTGSKTEESFKMVKETLNKEGGIIVFAEGTTSNGNRVLPFKSSLFKLIEENPPADLKIQPISIVYTRVNNIPMSMHLRPFFAWYGDMQLIPHLWQMLKFQSVTAEVYFHPSVLATEFKDRKEAANFCQEKISSSVSASLTGRKEEFLRVAQS
jgi:lyso-ornithine lipid O-acyltransferase